MGCLSGVDMEVRCNICHLSAFVYKEVDALIHHEEEE
jgi:hypothetical protein